MIVIGGSLGGMDALRVILRALPGDFPVPIAVVLHRHRDGDELLLRYLQRDIALRVREVEDKDPIVGGCVHVCPADYHLLLEGDCFSLSTDELVNFARPSVDVFFESAAEWTGAQTVGVILTGGGSDGAQGARAIQQRGGTVIVQDPKTAEAPWMPQAAIAATKAQIMTLDEIAAELLRLGRELGKGVD